jgi:hypothetical protein
VGCGLWVAGGLPPDDLTVAHDLPERKGAGMKKPQLVDWGHRGQSSDQCVAVEVCGGHHAPLITGAVAYANLAQLSGSRLGRLDGGPLVRREVRHVLAEDVGPAVAGEKEKGEHGS